MKNVELTSVRQWGVTYNNNYKKNAEHSYWTPCSGFDDWCNGLGNGWVFSEEGDPDASGDFCRHPCGHVFESCEMPRDYL